MSGWPGRRSQDSVSAGCATGRCACSAPEAFQAVGDDQHNAGEDEQEAQAAKADSRQRAGRTVRACMVGDEIRDEQAGSDAHKASDSQAGRQAQDQCRSCAPSAPAHILTIRPAHLLRLGSMPPAHQQQVPRNTRHARCSVMPADRSPPHALCRCGRRGMRTGKTLGWRAVPVRRIGQQAVLRRQPSQGRVPDRMSELAKATGLSASRTTRLADDLQSRRISRGTPEPQS